jgi:hypothetical protein
MTLQITISPLYGTALAQFGKWIVTSKGIVIKKTEPEPEDYFMDNATISQLSAVRTLLEDLLNENWLEAIDYHQFITAWFYKLSLTKINPDPDEPDLSDTLSAIQRMLETKFAGSLSSL